MNEFLLFKQLICIILFYETLVLWPKFYRYFGPPFFLNSMINSTAKVLAFNFFLLTNLILLFLNVLPVVTSFFAALCMRYLYVTDSSRRLLTAGAVGHMCFFVTAYIFLFELGAYLDPTHRLISFLYTVFGIEVGVIMITAGVYKYLLGYCHGEGFEYALVNPSWSKFFFLFNKLSPKSLFFTVNNYLACLGEIACGVFFIIPQTREWGAFLLILIFAYVLLVVRLSILPLIMMSISMLYLKPFSFHFPTLDLHFPLVQIPSLAITLIEAVMVLYLVILILATIYRLLLTFTEISFPKPVKTIFDAFRKWRPFFEWGVFTPGLTNFYVTIEKFSKETGELIDTVYDGFSKHYREIFEDPSLFFRYVHHHESSCILNIFAPFYFSDENEKKAYIKWFVTKMAKYGATLLSNAEGEAVAIKYTVILIEKKENAFNTRPLYFYLVDPKKEKVVHSSVYKTPEIQ